MSRYNASLLWLISRLFSAISATVLLLVMLGATLFKQPSRLREVHRQGPNVCILTLPPLYCPFKIMVYTYFTPNLPFTITVANPRSLQYFTFNDTHFSENRYRILIKYLYWLVSLLVLVQIILLSCNLFFVL